MAVLILIFAALLRTPPQLQAAPAATTWYVSTGGDDANSCTSIPAACATIAAALDKVAVGDTIRIGPGTFFESELQVQDGITLRGMGAEQTIIDGQQNGRVLDIAPATGVAAIEDLTVQNGAIITESAQVFSMSGGAIKSNGHAVLNNIVVSGSTTLEGGRGGGVFNSGTITITNSVIENNHSTNVGGGLANASSGTMTVIDSVINGNSSDYFYGGGVHNDNLLYLTNVTVSDNSAPVIGGGVYAGSAAVETVLTGTTVSGNSAVNGAGVGAFAGEMRLINSTVSGNVAESNFSAVHIHVPGASLTLQYSTIAGNSRLSDLGITRSVYVASGADMTVEGTIFGQTDGENCSITFGATVVSNGYNIATDDTCGLTVATDLENSDPLLTALGEYGGPTLTHALQPGSPAIDAADSANCPATDQRGISRPYDGDNDTVAVCDIGAVEAIHRLSIDDVAIIEDDGGSQNALFTVSLTPESGQTVTVDYTTVAGTAAAGSDFTAASDTLTFNPGIVEQTISIPITPDSDDEPDEQFAVRLSNAVNAGLLDRLGVATIIDDDGLPSLTIDDQTVVEGDSGSKNMIFTVTLSPDSVDTVTVDYGTVAGTAAAGVDFTAAADTLTFTPGAVARTITVPILGDDIDEMDGESFTVELSNPQNALIADSSGAGSITDDENARLEISAADVLEGDSGTTPGIFTFTLSVPAAYTINLDYIVFPVATSEAVPATPGVDFIGDANGALTFTPGESVKTVTVDIAGDEEAEGDERFGAAIVDADVPIIIASTHIDILDDDGYFVFIPFLTKNAP